MYMYKHARLKCADGVPPLYIVKVSHVTLWFGRNLHFLYTYKLRRFVFVLLVLLMHNVRNITMFL